MWRELPVVPRICISTHDPGAYDYVVRAFKIPVGIVSCFDRPAQQLPRSRAIRGRHRSWLQGSSPGIRQGELACSGGAIRRNIRAEGSEREIELLRQVL